MNKLLELQTSEIIGVNIMFDLSNKEYVISVHHQSVNTLCTFLLYIVTISAQLCHTASQHLLNLRHICQAQP